MVPATTVTVNRCVAVPCEPSASVAVTVTAAVPEDTGVTITTDPDTATDATAGVDDTAAYASASLSKSWNAVETSTASVPPLTDNFRSANVPTAWGGRFANPVGVTMAGALRDVSPPATTAATR